MTQCVRAFAGDRPSCGERANQLREHGRGEALRFVQEVNLVSQATGQTSSTLWIHDVLEHQQKMSRRQSTLNRSQSFFELSEVVLCRRHAFNSIRMFCHTSYRHALRTSRRVYVCVCVSVAHLLWHMPSWSACSRIAKTCSCCISWHTNDRVAFLIIYVYVCNTLQLTSLEVSRVFRDLDQLTCMLISMVSIEMNSRGQTHLSQPQLQP